MSMFRESSTSLLNGETDDLKKRGSKKEISGARRTCCMSVLASGAGWENLPAEGRRRGREQQPKALEKWHPTAVKPYKLHFGSYTVLTAAKYVSNL